MGRLVQNVNGQNCVKKEAALTVYQSVSIAVGVSNTTTSFGEIAIDHTLHMGMVSTENLNFNNFQATHGSCVDLSQLL